MSEYSGNGSAFWNNMVEKKPQRKKVGKMMELKMKV